MGLPKISMGIIFVLIALGGLFYPYQAQATQQAQGDPTDKIEPVLLQNLNITSQSDFFIWLTDKADLTPAYQLTTKAEKGKFVFETLRQTATTAQQPLLEELDQQGISYQSFYISNKVYVQSGTLNTLLNIAARPDVARITANHIFQFDEPELSPSPLRHITAIESNLSFIKADQVWAMGHTGTGIVLAGNDTGLNWDHPALIKQYRGWNGATVDHNYNWWDATGTYPTIPGDGHGHGTHTTGTMVGDDGGNNQIGVAPGAQTIHCKNMTNTGNGNDLTFTECFQWDLAPWDLNGNNPRSDLAPDAINNSWGYNGGNAPQFEDEIAALQAAGIVVEASAGNSGPGCQTLGSPGDYHQTLTTGSVDHSGGNLPGTLTGFSSRGASDLYPGEYIPDIMAPGQNIRSSLPGNSYASWNGTSMSGPHVTGLIGLLWSANPGLQGMVTETVQIILDTAVPLTGQIGSNCGGDYTLGPNNDWGYGSMDALSATQKALTYGHIGALAGTVTDGTSGTPIGNSTVRATSSPTQSWQISSTGSGGYALRLLSNTYTISATAYGYLPYNVSNISVMSGTTTTLDITLTQAPSYTVSGVITDADTGFPLYASLDIDGYPDGTIWTDPLSGTYSVTLPAGSSYNFNIAAANHIIKNQSVGPVTGNLIQNFTLQPNFSQGCPLGYNEVTIFADGFESGSLGSAWSTFTTKQGRVAVGLAYPYSGTYSTLLDNSTSGGSYSTAAIILTQNLSSSTGINLDFWWREFSDENHTQDGVFISDDFGVTWHNVLSFNNGPATFRNDLIDISAAAAANGLALNDHFQIKFQFYDNYSIPTDGYALDEVKLTACAPFTHGRLVGFVYDDNTGLPLSGATVRSDSGRHTTTGVTGYYEMLDSPGSHTLTTTMSGGYEADVQTINIVQNSTIQQNFNLPAGHLSPAPGGLEISLGLGENRTIPLSLINGGGAAAAFEFQEVDGGHHILTQLPPVQIPGYQTTTWETTTSYTGQHLVSSQSRVYQPPNTTLLNTPVDVLLLAAADVTQIQAILQAYPDINQVDYFNARLATPLLAELQDYDTVIVIAGFTFADPAATGDVLADYIDTGGTVIQTVPTFYGVGWKLQGRFVTQNYSPFIGTGDWFAWADLGTFDTGHPIMYGVTSAGDGLRQMITLDTDATLVASWTDDEFIATKGSVVALNTFLADGYNWTGDVGLIVHNSIVWLQAGGDVPWLSETPVSDTIESLATLPITITFDASVPEITQPGHYYAELKIEDNTPYNLVNIPVTMTVTPSPGLGKLTGTVNGLEHCDAPGTSLEKANLFLESDTGMTQTLSTDPDGAYAIWLDEANSPLTAIVSHPDYVTQTVTGINVTAGQTTTQNIDLRPNIPCIKTDPNSLELTITLGLSETLPLTVSNSGAAISMFGISEVNANVARQTDHLPTPIKPSVLAEIEAKTNTTDELTPNTFTTEPVIVQGLNQGILSCSETYGSWAGGTWSGSARDRGNIFLSSQNDILNEIQFYLNFPVTTDMYFFVYESTLLNGSYTKVFETHVADTGAGAGFRSSGLINVPLVAGKYYYIGASWNGMATYGRGTESVPLPTCFGTLQTGVLGSVGYPPNNGFNNTWSGFPPYYMHLELGADIPWLSENPINGVLAADTGSQLIDVTFDASVVTQTGKYYASLLVNSDGPVNNPLNIPVTMTVVAYGVALDPPIAALSGDPGNIVTHSLRLTNTGKTTDTYDVTLNSLNGWSIVAPFAIGPLAPGTGQSLNVVVTIPTTAMGEAQDMTTVIVTSQGLASQSDQAVLTTTAHKQYGVMISPDGAAKSGKPGGVITYPLTITNRGNTTDTFYLSAADNIWPVVTSLTQDVNQVTIMVGPVPAATSQNLELMVLIPANAPEHDQDTATITATSQSNLNVSTGITLTTTADSHSGGSPTQIIFLPIIIK